MLKHKIPWKRFGAGNIKLSNLLVNMATLDGKPGKEIVFGREMRLFLIFAIYMTQYTHVNQHFITKHHGKAALHSSRLCFRGFNVLYLKWI